MCYVASTARLHGEDIATKKRSKSDVEYSIHNLNRGYRFLLSDTVEANVLETVEPTDVRTSCFEILDPVSTLYGRTD
jgi:hypothetical protein